MKAIFLAVTLTRASLALGVDMNDNVRVSTRVMTEIRGSTLRWLYLVEGEIRSKKLDLDKYEVSVTESEDVVVVVLRVSGQPVGQRGHSGAAPGLEIEVSKVDGKIVGSHFIR